MSLAQVESLRKVLRRIASDAEKADLLLEEAFLGLEGPERFNVTHAQARAILHEVAPLLRAIRQDAATVQKDDNPYGPNARVRA